jgi:hypothetical protein
MDQQKQFRRLALQAKAKDLQRVLASGSLAVHKGMAPAIVLDCLLRNQPELFDSKAALQHREMLHRV